MLNVNKYLRKRYNSKASLCRIGHHQPPWDKHILILFYNIILQSFEALKGKNHNKQPLLMIHIDTIYTFLSYLMAFSPKPEE